MITLEDLLEEIVGEIRDEYDEDEEELIQKMSDDTYLVEGSLKLDDINDALGTDLTSEDYDSIGGLIIDCLDRLVDDAGQEIYRNSGQKIRHPEFRRVPHVRQIAVDQTDIIRIYHIIKRGIQIPQAEHRPCHGHQIKPVPVLSLHENVLTKITNFPVLSPGTPSEYP